MPQQPMAVADVRGILLVDGSATLDLARACICGTSADRLSVTANRPLIHGTSSGDFSVAPLRPFGVIQQRRHRTALVLVRPPQAVARVGSDAVENCVPARALVNLRLNRVVFVRHRRVDAVEAVAEPEKAA
jgi:hypothetical protein